jgi:hypothetical protein
MLSPPRGTAIVLVVVLVVVVVPTPNGREDSGHVAVVVRWLVLVVRMLFVLVTNDEEEEEDAAAVEVVVGMVRVLPGGIHAEWSFMTRKKSDRRRRCCCNNNKNNGRWRCWCCCCCGGCGTILERRIGETILSSVTDDTNNKLTYMNLEEPILIPITWMKISSPPDAWDISMDVRTYINVDPYYCKSRTPNTHPSNPPSPTNQQ